MGNREACAEEGGTKKREEEWKGEEMRDRYHSHPSGKVAQLLRRSPSFLWPRVQSHFPLFFFIILTYYYTVSMNTQCMFPFELIKHFEIVILAQISNEAAFNLLHILLPYWYAFKLFTVIDTQYM